MFRAIIPGCGPRVANVAMILPRLLAFGWLGMKEWILRV